MHFSVLLSISSTRDRPDESPCLLASTDTWASIELDIKLFGMEIDDVNSLFLISFQRTILLVKLIWISIDFKAYYQKWVSPKTSIIPDWSRYGCINKSGKWLVDRSLSSQRYAPNQMQMPRIIWIIWTLGKANIKNLCTFNTHIVSKSMDGPNNLPDQIGKIYKNGQNQALLL